MIVKLRFFFTLCLFACVSFSMASPALRYPFSIRLSSGEEVVVVKCGDEHRHWMQTQEGEQLILGDETSGYRIATAEEKEAFFSSPATAKVRKISAVDKFTPVFPTTGKMRSLVILANFADVKMQSPTANDDFQRMMTETGYGDLGGTGSARDYYIENSMGVFQPQFDVVGPVTLPNGYAYYGENDKTGEDMHAEQMIIDACRAVDDVVDFTEYDYNNDGYIDNVFVFYAGYGEATYSDPNTVWPHSWDIVESTSIPIMFDGKRLNHYACTNELDKHGVMDGIGTFVHEFGHVLGLPDFYPTTGSVSAFTPNIWSVMDEGEYNNNSRTPPYFTAVERYLLGWLVPVEVLAEGCSVAINPIANNEAYIIHTANRNEYFLLENRQQVGWDAYIPGHGMLVWHIDYDAYLWEKNRVNNVATHQYCDIVEADNIQSTGTKNGDTFPGASNVTAFTAETSPAFVDWKGNDVGVPLTNIREEDGMIFFDAAGGGAPLEPMRYIQPVAEEASEVTSTSFLAKWQSVEDIDGYRVGVCSIRKSEPKTDIATMTGGIAAITGKWTTNVTSTYNNASYAGESTPSLRMQRESDKVECHHENIAGISFWCRGSSVKAGTVVEIEWLTDGSKLLGKDTYELTATGTTVKFDAPDAGRESVGIVRITYRPAEGSGSLAIDDIAVTYADNIYELMGSETDVIEPKMTITGLTPDTDYAYYVVAVKGEMTSRKSEYVTLHTLTIEEDNGVEMVETAADANSAIYNLSGQRVLSPRSATIYIRNGKKYTY